MSIPEKLRVVLDRPRGPSLCLSLSDSDFADCEQNKKARGITSPYLAWSSHGLVKKCAKVECDHDAFVTLPEGGKVQEIPMSLSHASPIPEEK